MSDNLIELDSAFTAHRTLVECAEKYKDAHGVVVLVLRKDHSQSVETSK